MKANTAKLMAIDGVVGVGLGELDDKTPCIIIMVIMINAELTQQLPTIIEGFPVKIIESGVIKPM